MTDITGDFEYDDYGRSAEPWRNDAQVFSAIMGAHCVKVSDNTGEPIEYFKSPPVLLGRW